MTAPDDPGLSWTASVFDRLYARDPDPWRLATSEYERAKHAVTLALLPRERRFRSALELGCSIGVFTARLAPRCEHLLAVDFAEAAIAHARARCASHPHVEFRRSVVPHGMPDGTRDLVVASEILYFLSPEDTDTLARRVAATLAPAGLVLLANWTGPTDSPQTGDAAATRFIGAGTARFRHLACLHQHHYRLDLLSA